MNVMRDWVSPLVTLSDLNLFFPVTMPQYYSALLVRSDVCKGHAHEILPRGVATETGSRIIGYFPYHSG